MALPAEAEAEEQEEEQEQEGEVEERGERERCKSVEREREKEEMKDSVKKVEAELKAAVEKIQEFENFQKQEEAVARFNSRMEVIDQGYELDDEDRKVLASDLKELAATEEAFASYQEKLAVMWKHKNKEAKAAFEKQIQARIDEEVAKKISVSNAFIFLKLRMACILTRSYS
jgi:hypothetical protein